MALVFAFATAPSARADLPHSIAAKDAAYCTFTKFDDLSFAKVLGYCKEGNAFNTEIDGSGVEILVKPSKSQYSGDLKRLEKLPDLIRSDLLAVSECEGHEHTSCRLNETDRWIPPIIGKAIESKDFWELGPRPKEDFLTQVLSRFDVSIYFVQLGKRLIVIVAHFQIGGVFDDASLAVRRYDFAVINE